MGFAVLERDSEQLSSLCASAQVGELAAQKTAFVWLLQIVGRPTSWQWVIHGDTREYRQGVVRFLCRQGEWTRAFRFAMCGRGDIACEEVGGDDVRVKARGCGCRFCPRCSRRSGQRFLRRISGHLETAPHGEIWHVVLTQRLRPGEPVQVAAERFGKAWKRWYGALRRAGMRSALLTQHVKPRPGVGWHYHGHCVVEFNPGVDGSAACAALETKWQRAVGTAEFWEKGLFRRLVCGPGPAMGKGGMGDQGEFWSEPEGAVQRCLQYTVRDVVQGCEGWVEHLRTVEDIEGFVQVIAGAKLHRLYGAWRKKSAEESVGDGSLSEDKAAAAPVGPNKGSDKVWHEIGNISRVWETARSGDTVSLGYLERLNSRYRNHGKLYRRLARALQSCSAARRAG